MPGAWVISPAQIDSNGKRITYVSTLEDKSLPQPHPQLGLPWVVYENYRTADVVSVLLGPIQDWTLSFVRTDNFTNLIRDPLVEFVFDHSHEDLEYFIGRTFVQNEMGEPDQGPVGLSGERKGRDALMDIIEEGFPEIAETQARANAVDNAPMWEVLADIGRVLQPGWTPYGTYVAP